MILEHRKNPISMQMVARVDTFIADFNSELLPIQKCRPD